MVEKQDNYSTYVNESHYELSVFSSIGGRETQQDSACYQIDDYVCIAAVADGMGGHEGGKNASAITVQNLELAFKGLNDSTRIPEKFKEAVNEADNIVSSLTDDNGNPLHAGTTFSGVVVKDNMLYWCSVGDSRIYLLRDGNLKQITRDHTYQMVLDNKLKNGKISEEEYVKAMKNADTLISYVGMGGITLTDCNEDGIELENEDKILICTDGLYKLVSDKHIQKILENFTDLEDCLQALNYKAITMDKKSKIDRDNTTMALIRIKL